MNAFWSYFWPAFAAGLVIGALAATYGFRRYRLRPALVAGALAAIAAAALWHGPFGGADRFSTRVDRAVRQTFIFYEIPEVHGQLHRGPLTRQVELAGPADDFQRTELKRLVEDLSGVSKANWGAAGGVPLIIQGTLAALLGFLSGLLLAYLIELRRRINAHYNW